MRFRLDFTQECDGKFVVDAHAAEGPATRSGRNSCAVLYADAKTFCELIDCAGLDDETARAMRKSVEVAESQPGTTTCCQQAELNGDQLDWLNLGPARELFGS